jgi:uncharacterized damage-inducible protein DinB
MASSLVEIFGHNQWANLRLLERCAGLTDAQLELSAPGTYGTVRATLVHLVGAEQRYVAALEGREAPASLESGPFPGFEVLHGMASESGEKLVQIATPNPTDRILHLIRRGQAYDIDSAHFLLQAINHATEHRGHVVSILTQNGVEMPELDGWAYSEEHGLIRPVPA